jgi:hypothetical protein
VIDRVRALTNQEQQPEVEQTTVGDFAIAKALN